MQLNLTEEQKLRNQKIGKLISDIAYFTVLIAFIGSLLSYGITWKTTGKPNVLGYRHFCIASGSMEPVIMTRQFVLTKTIAPEEIKIDDIIAYKSEDMGKIIIHRVIDVQKDENGKLLFTFKGDNNPAPDPYYVTEDMIMYKVILY